MAFFTSGKKFTEVDPTALKIANNLNDLANVATARSNLSVYSIAEVDAAIGALSHDGFADFVAAEHIDWTQPGAGTIDPTNYTDNDTTDHTLLSNIGINTHAQIDSHIADSSLHFTEASIDHGSIAGLADDDHTQYALADGTRDITGPMSIDGAYIARSSLPINSLAVGVNPASMIGGSNTIVGVEAGLNITSSVSNTFVGAQAGRAHSTGGSNSAFGVNALRTLSNGLHVTALGTEALELGTSLLADTAIGFRAGEEIVTSLNGVYIGAFAAERSNNNDSAILIGKYAGSGGVSTSWVRSIGIGVRFGAGQNVVVTDCIGIGSGSEGLQGPKFVTNSNEFVLGSPNSPITEMYLGEGGLSTSPGSVAMQPTAAEGTDISAGPFFDISGGRGTGTGTGSHVRIRTAPPGVSGSTLNALVTRIEVTDTGEIGLHGATPVAQGGAIADAAGGTIVDAEARAAINALLTYLRSRGDIAT